MNRRKRRTRTFYQYAAAYFVVLFLLSGVIMIGVLRFSADKLIALETQNARSNMQLAADSLENQYQALESIAVQIGTTANYRPNMITRSPVYDIALLEGFKQYTNYSPLSRQYFLAYRSVRKIYTSAGNTSYFEYYAPANLEVLGDPTKEMFRRIIEATTPSFEFSQSHILMVFPVRFYGYDTSNAYSAALCFALKPEEIKQYIAQVSVGLPEQYRISIDGHAFLGSQDGGMESAEDETGFLKVSSADGRVTLSALPELAGWQLLFSQSSSLFYIGAAALLLLASLLALVLAHFTLLPLEKLISKYALSGPGIESEFRQLDTILSNMDQLHKGSRHQLRNHLLVMLLKGNYNEKLIERWSMLGIVFDQPVCCVYLIEKGVQPQVRDALEHELEGRSDQLMNLYIAQAEEDDQLIVIANYAHTLSGEEVLRRIQFVTEGHALRLHAGKPVDSPKRLPLSYMSALTASRYDAPSSPQHRITADSVASLMLEAAEAGDEGALDSACAAVSQFLCESPADGLLTKHHFYELISSIAHKAEERGMQPDRTEMYALVLLPDANMIANDLRKMLLACANQSSRPVLSSDNTSRPIVEYVIANAYDPDISLRDMSDTFGLSADYISSMIKRETGSAFKEYLTLLRISEARRLLAEDSTLTVNDVAFKVGYRKASNFSKKFKELTGVLPSQI